ncbi:MAG: hypothetical protein RIC52_14965, partial [Amphiplicatus sp.]
MGSFARLIIGVPVAIIVTAILFLIMSGLIRQDVKLEEEKDSLKLNITAQIQDTDISNINKEFKRPTLDTPPPPPPAVNDPSN